MVLLVLLSAGPHIGCLCKPGAINRTDYQSDLRCSQKEHSCCKKQVSATCDSVDTSFVSIGKYNSCCGMNGLILPMASISMCPTGEAGQLHFQLVFLSGFEDWHGTIRTLHTFQANRAPPYIVGLGSSKTYLFKRALLI